MQEDTQDMKLSSSDNYFNTCLLTTLANSLFLSTLTKMVSATSLVSFLVVVSVKSMTVHDPPPISIATHSSRVCSCQSPLEMYTLQGPIAQVMTWTTKVESSCRFKDFLQLFNAQPIMLCCYGNCDIYPWSITCLWSIHAVTMTGQW